MAKQQQPQRATEAAVIESFGDMDDVPAGPPAPQAPPKISGRLTAARVVDQRHRAADYPGSERFRCRALGGEYESAYVVAPAGPDAAAVAKAEYLRTLNLDAVKVAGVEVKRMPD